jgi:hypothetical protein
MHKRSLLFSLIFTLLLLISPAASFAQCAMCKASVESNQKENDSKIGAGLNKGILYLMGIPYALGLVGGIAWYVNRKNLSRNSETE